MTTRPARPARSTAASVTLVVTGAAVLVGSLTMYGLGGDAATSVETAGAVPTVEAPVLPAAADSAHPDGPGGDSLPDRPQPVAPVRPPAPERLRAGSVDLDALITPITADSAGALRVPEDGDLVGWWSAGPRPGDATGTVVLTGHVDTWNEGPGAMARASRLRPGDRVEVAAPGRTTRYTVAAVRRYAKSELPAEVFAGYGRPRLVLVTCGGEFDERTRRYADNVVVYALPEAAAAATPAVRTAG